jgi:hypothetical protein
MLAHASNSVQLTEKCSLDNRRFIAVRQYPGKEPLRHLARQQPVAVLRECRGFPYRVLNAQPDKPAEQQIVINPLDELPLRADRIEGLRQQRPHQPLRRDRAAPDRRIELSEFASRHRRVRGLANHPQRMIRPNPILQVYVPEKAAANLVVAAHRHPLPRSSRAQCANLATFFQHPS